MAPALFWLAVLMVGEVPAEATTGALAPKDEAGFFSAAALKTAGERIKELDAKYQIPVLLETFKAIPEEKAKGLDLLDIRVREKLFADWGRERLQASKIDGVGILICKDPAYIFIALGDMTRQTRLTPADRRVLISMMINRFVDRRFDDGLLDTLATMEDFAKNNRERPPASPSTAANDDDSGAGGEATPLNIVGPRIRIAGVGLRGARDATPLPPPPQETIVEVAPGSWLDGAGAWLVVISGGLVGLVFVILLTRWMLPGRAYAPAQPAELTDE